MGVMNKDKEVKALSVADYLLYKANKESRPITNKKLQKILYYIQAWSLAVRDKKVFDDKIEAWIHGPAIREVYLNFKEFGAAPIQNARKKARDSKKIAEIKGVQLALDQYAEANAGQYPMTLLSLSPTYMPLLPGFVPSATTTVSPRDMFAYTPYEVTGQSLRPTVFAYHLGAHLENYSQGLDNDQDCMGAENKSGYTLMSGTTTCGFYPATNSFIDWYYDLNRLPGMIIQASGFTTNATGDSISVYQTGGAAGTSTDDFSGVDGNITTCNATEDCLFDVTGQQ
jgi:uncharacterized phage-associated protein